MLRSRRLSVSSAPWLEAAFTVPVPSPTDKLVLLALARRADADGASAVGQRELMTVTGLSERAVRDALAALERAGLLIRGRGAHQLHLDGAADGPDRHDLPVEAADRHVAPVHDAAALRRAVVAEAGEWRTQSLFDTGRLEAGVLHARSPAAAAQLRRLAALAGVEVRTAPPSARTVGTG